METRGQGGVMRNTAEIVNFRSRWLVNKGQKEAVRTADVMLSDIR